MEIPKEGAAAWRAKTSTLTSQKQALSKLSVKNHVFMARNGDKQRTEEPVLTSLDEWPTSDTDLYQAILRGRQGAIARDDDWSGGKQCHFVGLPEWLETEGPPLTISAPWRTSGETSTW